MNDITDWEIAMLIPMALNSHKTEWETARYISYNNAIMSGNLKKQYAEKPMSELFPLPYDKHVEQPHNIEMSDYARDELRRRGQRLSKKLHERNMKKKNTNGEHSKIRNNGGGPRLQTKPEADGNSGS